MNTENTAANKTLNGTSDSDSIKNSGALVKIYAQGGKDTVENSASLVTIQSGDGNDSIENKGDYFSSNWISDIKIYGGTGRDSIYNQNSSNVTISGGDGNDSIKNDSYTDSIIAYGGAGNDTISNDYGDNVTIDGGDGDDYIYSRYDRPDGDWYQDEDEDEEKYAYYPSNNSVSGGAGDDTIEIQIDEFYYEHDASDYGTLHNIVSGGTGNDIVILDSNIKFSNTIQYTSGDGDDTIVGFKSTDTLQITSGGYTTVKSGNDLFFVFNNGSITLEDAANVLKAENIVTLKGGNSSGSGGSDGGDNSGEETNSWTISGTTAKYGTSSKTLVTVKGVKSVDGLSLKGKVVTVADSSLNNSKVTISNGYKLKLASDVTKSSTKTAAWNYSNSTATYKSSSKTAGYSLASNGKSISYTKATSGKTLATVKGAKSKKGLSLSGKKISLKNSALNKKVTVSGSYEFDFASDYKNATIRGTAKADTITARGSNLKIFGGAGKDSISMVGTNQTISGGAGADTFIYVASGGSERITDFSTNDKLKIGTNGDGSYSTVTSGDNLIVSTDDGGKITLAGAASLSNVNIEGTKKTSGAGIKVSGKKITLTSDFEDGSFSLSGKYSSAVTLDASAALLELSITGNNFSNRIIGSPQNDTIDGGAGNDTIFGGNGSDSIFGGTGDDELHGGKGKDTLWGGAGDDALYGDDGKDVFYYNTGEGNDTIFGYEASVDKIILANGSISNVTTDRNNNVIFSVGDGQIVVNNCADRTVKIVNSSGKIVDNGLYEP